MALFCLVMGSIVGALGGLSAHRWVYGSFSGCNGPGTKVVTPFGFSVACDAPPSSTPYVVVGVLVGVAGLSAWTWWMLNRPSTVG
jgi:hypothetical protein